MTPALVIFDCDGVLVDTEPMSNAVLARCLTEAGLPTTAEQALATYRGLLLGQVRELAEQRLGRPLPDDFLDRYERERDVAFRAGELAPIPGAAAAVTTLSDAGIAVCVASQGRRSKTEMTLTMTGLRPLFGPDALFSSHDVPRGKPSPDVYLHAAAAMGSPPEQCVVVEDTPIGARAGIAAGMHVLGLAADPAAARELAAVGAQPLGSLDELGGRLVPIAGTEIPRG